MVFLEFDQHLLAPRFGAGEEALALLARAARLVGARGRGRPGPGADPGSRTTRRWWRRSTPTPGYWPPPSGRCVVSSGCRPSAPWRCCAGPGASAYAGGLRGVAGLEVSGLDAERFLVRAADHAALSDGLAAVPRPAGRLRVEVDPADA